MIALETLQFSDANAKLEKLYQIPELQVWLADGRKVYSLDLLSGWSCPFAKDCLSKVHDTGNPTKSGNPQDKLKDHHQLNHELIELSFGKYIYVKMLVLLFLISNKAGSMYKAQTVQVIIPSSTTAAMEFIPAW